MDSHRVPPFVSRVDDLPSLDGAFAKRVPVQLSLARLRAEGEQRALGAGVEAGRAAVAVVAGHAAKAQLLAGLAGHADRRRRRFRNGLEAGSVLQAGRAELEAVLVVVRVVAAGRGGLGRRPPMIDGNGRGRLVGVAGSHDQHGGRGGSAKQSRRCREMSWAARLWNQG